MGNIGWWVIWDTVELKIVTCWSGITEEPRYLNNTAWDRDRERYKRIKLDIIDTLERLDLSGNSYYYR